MGTTAQKFFQIATDQADTWGTTVRLLHPSDTTATNNTQIQFGTGTANATKTAIPHAASTLTGDQRNNYGWALDPTGANGMDSTATRKRRIVGGIWTFNVNIEVPTPGAVSGSITCQPGWAIYRVGASPGFTRTVLFTASAAQQSTTALSGGQTLSFTTTFNFGTDIILEPGETIHVGMLVVSQQTAGLAGAVVTNTQTIDTGSGTFVQVSSPGIRDLAISNTTGAVASSATITNLALKALGGTVNSTGAITRNIYRFFSGAITPVAQIFNTTFKVLSGHTATSAATLIKTDKKTGNGSIPSSGAIVRKPNKLLVATISPAGAIIRFISRRFSGAMVPSATLKKVYGKNLFGFLYGPAGNGSGGGGPTIIKKIINIFDD